MSFAAKKTLIVTGASRGIGRSLAHMLAGQGANLVLNARGGEALEQAAAEARRAGGQVVAVAGSAADEQVACRLWDAAVELSVQNGTDAPYGFIHVAGVANPGPLLWELDPEKFHEVFDASVTAGYMLAHVSFPELTRLGRGLAVFFGSGAAQISQPGMAAYCAAKAAEEHMARQLAAEAPAVCSFSYRPHIVDTRMQERAREATGGGQHHLRATFQAWKDKGQLITPEEAARGLVKLLERDPAELTGKTFRWGEF